MALTGCTLLVDTSGLHVDGSAPRGAPDGSSDASDAAATDASDATVCDAAAPPETIALSDPEWILRGNAALDGSSVILTPSAMNQQGAIWWNEPMRFDRFDLTATIRIAGAPDTLGDGLAFAWVAGQPTPGVGDNGGGLGIEGIGTGYGVAIDTFGDFGSAHAPYLTLIDLSKPDETWSIAAKSITSPLADDRDHTLRVVLESGSVTASVDDIVLIDHVALPNPTPFVGHWGFTGATGDNTETNRIVQVVRAASCP